MKQASRILTLQTRGPGMYDFTRDIRVFTRETEAVEGVLTLMCRHTSASLTIQENADPDVQTDLQDAMDQISPHDPSLYIHGAEGPDDMPAHIRTVLSGVTLSIPLMDGRLTLGTWQSVYLWEHRDAPHQRQVAAHLLYQD